MKIKNWLCSFAVWWFLFRMEIPCMSNCTKWDEQIDVSCFFSSTSPRKRFRPNVSLFLGSGDSGWFIFTRNLGTDPIWKGYGQGMADFLGKYDLPTNGRAPTNLRLVKYDKVDRPRHSPWKVTETQEDSACLCNHQISRASCSSSGGVSVWFTSFFMIYTLPESPNRTCHRPTALITSGV